MLNHYLLLVWRHLRSSTGYFVVNVTSLTLGLCCFFLSYTAYIYVNSIDKNIESVENVFFMYGRGQQPGTDHWFPYRAAISPAVYKYAGEEFPEIEVLARSARLDDLLVQVGARKEYRNVMFADTQFLNIFTGWSFVSKSQENPLANPKSAIISIPAAEKMFGRANVLGEQILVDGKYSVTITGIVDQLQENSYAGNSFVEKPWDFLVSIDVFNEIQSIRSGFDVRDSATRDIWNVSPYIVHIKFSEDKIPSVVNFNARLQSFADKYRKSEDGRIELKIEPITGYMNFVVNQKLFGNAKGLSVTSVLLLLGVLVLSVSCLNYSNLSIAQAGARVKEIGMRKVIGAGRNQIFMQFMTEIVCHAILACVLSAIIVAILIPVVCNQFGLYGLSFSLLYQWASVGVLFLTVLLISLTAGVYPSLQMAGMRPAISLQQGKSKMGARKLIAAMSGIQFAVSGFLLTAVMLMFVHNASQRQLMEADNQDEQIVLLENSFQGAGISFDAFRDRLLTEPGITSVSGAYDLPFGSSLGAGGYRTVVGESMEDSSYHFDIQRKMVNYDFFKTLGLKILFGRSFERERGADETPLPSRPDFLTFDQPGRIVVDLETANLLTDNNPQQALGSIIYEKDLVDMDGEKASMPLEIIGVVENSPYRLVSDSVSLEMYLLQPLAARRPLVRIKTQQVDSALAHLDRTWNELGASQPVRRSFMDQQFEKAYAFFDAMGKSFSGLSLIALVIACSGLIAMASYILQKRRNEIAIRKVLGAHNVQIMKMVLKELTIPIFVANIISWPITYFVMREYFKQFISQPTGVAWVYPTSLGIIMLIAWSSTLIQLLSTTKIKPALMLRYQ